MSSQGARFSGAGTMALILGATGIGLAPILVRLSHVDPVATAFYRILLAQPILWIILKREPKTEAAPPTKRHYWMTALAGLCFAGDLAVWHWSIHLTTVANSTLFTNFAPVFVIIGARILFGEQITKRIVVGMLIAFVGGFLLVAESLQLDRRFIVGDLLGLVTAIFYASYLLCVKSLRKTQSVWFVMTWSGVFCAPVLLAIALLSKEKIMPPSAYAWGIVAGLAFISHLGGQGLITYGLRHISASISAILLMLQPVVAALLAWWILNEPLTTTRVIGGLIIMAGIFFATIRPQDTPK